MDDYRVETLMRLRKLERLDKEAFTEDERADAEEVSHEAMMCDSGDCDVMVLSHYSTVVYQQAASSGVR